MLADVLMEQEGLTNEQNDEIKAFLDKPHEIKSRDPATLQLYYSQLTKAEIRKLYKKYKLDHDLFGFDPDYFIAMGKGS